MGVGRQCVCGCGRELPRRRVATNLLAFEVMGELVEFDRLRYLMQMSESYEPDNLDAFINDGVYTYESVINYLHDEGGGVPRGTKRWLKFAYKSRQDLARTTGLVRADRGPLSIRDEDLPYVNLRAPHLSFTGNPELQAAAAEARAEAALDEEPAPLDVKSWIDEAALICTDDFEPIAEQILQIGTLRMLGLDSWDVLGGDTPAATVSNARFGYALRNAECQHIPPVEAELSDDLLLAAVDESGFGPYGDSRLWLPELIHEVIANGKCGGANATFDRLPGVSPQMRREAFAAWGERWPSDDPYTGRRITEQLVTLGYLLHRVREMRPNLINDEIPVQPDDAIRDPDAELDNGWPAGHPFDCPICGAVVHGYASYTEHYNAHTGSQDSPGLD